MKYDINNGFSTLLIKNGTIKGTLYSYYSQLTNLNYELWINSSRLLIIYSSFAHNARDSLDSLDSSIFPFPFQKSLCAWLVYFLIRLVWLHENNSEIFISANHYVLSLHLDVASQLSSVNSFLWRLLFVFGHYTSKHICTQHTRNTHTQRISID